MNDVWAWLIANQVELLATATGALSVWLTVRQNPWCWPVGLVNAVTYTYVFFEIKLYADTGLQIVYFFLGIYGWYHWLWPSKTTTELPVTRLTRPEWAVALAMIALFTLFWGTLFSHTDAAYPWLDSLTVGMSLAAQWMITQKKLENWILWIIADIIMVPMYASKGIWLTSGLYILFLVLAVAGWREWRRVCVA